jgi:hypothetical protein
MNIYGITKRFAAILIPIVLFTSCQSTTPAKPITPTPANTSIIESQVSSFSSQETTVHVTEKPSASPEQEPEAAYAKFDEEAGTVTVNGVVFSECSQYKVHSPEVVSFYSEIEGGYVWLDGLETYVQIPPYDGYMGMIKTIDSLNELPKFVNEDGSFSYENMMKFFVENHDIWACITVKDLEETPWSNIGVPEYSEELKALVDEEINNLEPGIIDIYRRVGRDLKKSFVEPYAPEKGTTYKNLEYDENIYSEEWFEENFEERVNRIVSDMMGANPEDYNCNALYVGPGMASILIYSDVEYGHETQEDVLEHYNSYRELVKDYSNFFMDYSQENFDIITHKVTEASLSSNTLFLMYVRGYASEYVISTPEGERDLRKISLLFRGTEDSGPQSFINFIFSVDSATDIANKLYSNLFNKTFDDINN